MGGCLGKDTSTATAEKPRRQRTSETNQTHNSTTTPMVINANQNYDNLHLGSPTDRMDLEQEQLRLIISKVSKDFIDVASHGNNSPFFAQVDHTKLMTRTLSAIPDTKEAAETLDQLPVESSSNAVSALLSGLNAKEIDFVNQCANEIAGVFDGMKVQHCGDIVVSFPG